MPAMPASPWRAALVTGASSGIGEAFALELARRGAGLVLVARRRARLEELAAGLTTAHGVKVEVLEADLADAGARAEVEARLADVSRPIDLLVNNAGFATQGRFATLPVDMEEQEVLVNVLAVVRLTHAALGGMVERGHGSVVNVSSISGHQPLPLWATYSSSKAFVTTFSRALDAEVARTGVRVMALIPGFTRTEFHDTAPFTRQLIPGPAWMTAQAVATRALQDLEQGKGTSIPGWHNRALAAASRLSPWPLTRTVLRIATRGMR